MKKRLSALMLALVMTFSLAGCASPAQSSGGNLASIPASLFCWPRAMSIEVVI